jgi:glycosyltransferase involved in cell wall biosynthesis
MRVGYDIAPISLNRAGERRYAAALRSALVGVPGVEVRELTLSRRAPGSLAQRIAYQAVAEGIYYPFLVGARARRERVDLVHHPRHLVPPEFGLGVPSVVTVHDVLPLAEPEHYSQLILRRYEVLARLAVRRAALVATGSEYSAGELERRLGVPKERIRVTPYGVEERFRPVPPEPGWLHDRFGIDRPYVLIVGTLEPRKNLAGAVRAFEELDRRLPGHLLVFAGGTGWKRSAFEGVVGASRAPMVRTGYISDGELVRLYSGAACFVFPSLSEGFGFPVLEAMACGAPVVATDRTSVPELVGDAGVLVDPQSPEQIADGLARVLEDRELAAELRRRGLKRAALYTWPSCAEATVAVYREVLGDRGA